MQFPRVSGSNLLGDKVQLPDQLDADFNVLVVAFQRWHQSLVDSWVPFLESLVEKNSDLDYYELPTIRRMNWLYRTMLDNGMRAGIPSRETRRRTITLYIDKEPFKKQLAIPDENNVHLFLVTSEGEVLWNALGGFDEEKGKSLSEALGRARGS
ncbi:MAG: hypothetical protein AM324_005490 [Candidatus Thorarchaeota archaeon SMTZ1-83]|nr:MAG: hypothetical protein AM324_06730 [Candidatus Thorarchaeota archaeon SMTZ1-83]